MSQLYKCVSLGAQGMIEPGSPQDYRNNRAFFAETGTQWVRMWADWPTLQPGPGDPVRASPSGFYWDNLTAQIEAAKSDGLKVILVAYRFPLRTNAQRRASSASQRPNRGDADWFCFPDFLDVNSEWGQWIDLLAERYGANGPGPQIDMLEFINEPNGQCWPQGVFGQISTADGTVIGDCSLSACLVAQMFATCRIIHKGNNNEVLMGGRTEPYPFDFLGPGTDDHKGTDGNRQDYLNFTRVCAVLVPAFTTSTRGLRWSHHNYTDVTYDQGLNSTAPDASNKAQGRQVNRAAAVRAAVSGQFGEVWLTEGGVQREKLKRAPWNVPAGNVDAKQADLINRSWNRMSNDTPGEGAGIVMSTQYLYYSSPQFDSGIRNYPSPDGNGSVRQAPWDAWTSKPGRTSP